MPDEKDTFGGLLGNIVVGLGATLLLAIITNGGPPRRPLQGAAATPAGIQGESPPEAVPSYCTRTGEVSLGELSLAQINETFRGRKIPPDALVMSQYTESEKITCWHCGGTFYVNGLNTQLVAYEVHPQYTHLSSSCPSPECRGGYATIYYDDYRLLQYLAAGYPGTLAGYEVTPTIRKIFRAKQPTVIRRAQDATGAQRTVYAAVLATASGQKLVTDLETLLADLPPS